MSGVGWIEMFAIAYVCFFLYLFFNPFFAWGSTYQTTSRHALCLVELVKYSPCVCICIRDGEYTYDRTGLQPEDEKKKKKRKEKERKRYGSNSSWGWEIQIMQHGQHEGNGNKQMTG